MDLIYTIFDYYDGPISGVTSLDGEPHFYQCIFDESADEYSKNYYLSPISNTTFELVQEQWAFWLRWQSAFKEGKVEARSHPALPEDIKRNDQIHELTRFELCTCTDRAVLVKANFHVPKEPNWASQWTVKWERLDVT